MLHIMLVALASVCLLVTTAFAAVPDNCRLRCDADMNDTCGASDYLRVGLNFGKSCTSGQALDAWGNACTAVEDCTRCGDFNGDGGIGAPDYLIAGAEFGKTGCVFAKPASIASLYNTYISSDDFEFGAWKHVQDWADKSFATTGNHLFCDQESDDDQIALAKALRWAAIGGSSYKEAVESELALIQGESQWKASAADGCEDNNAQPAGDDIGTARNLAGYVYAASLIWHGDNNTSRTAFQNWVYRMLWSEPTGAVQRTLVETVRRRPNNVGSNALASTAAAFGWLKYHKGLATPAMNDGMPMLLTLFRRHLGDRSTVLSHAHLSNLSFGAGTNQWQPEDFSSDPASIIPLPATTTDDDIENDAAPGTYFDGAGLLPEERENDSTTSYAKPWTAEIHETGYASSILHAAMVLGAQDPTFDPWSWYPTGSTEPPMRTLIETLLGQNWQGAHSTNGRQIFDDDDNFARCLWRPHYDLTGTLENEAKCCLDPGTTLDHAVGDSLGFTGFLFFPDIPPDFVRTDCSL